MTSGAPINVHQITLEAVGAAATSTTVGEPAGSGDPADRSGADDPTVLGDTGRLVAAAERVDAGATCTAGVASVFAFTVVVGFAVAVGFGCAIDGDVVPPEPMENRCLLCWYPSKVKATVPPAVAGA
jgi:hypothetical protein